MKELNAEKTQLLIDYLNKLIDHNRISAEIYRKSGQYQHALVAEAKAAEHKCTLAYLRGLIFEE